MENRTEIIGQAIHKVQCTCSNQIEHDNCNKDCDHTFNTEPEFNSEGDDNFSIPDELSHLKL